VAVEVVVDDDVLQFALRSTSGEVSGRERTVARALRAAFNLVFFSTSQRGDSFLEHDSDKEDDTRGGFVGRRGCAHYAELVEETD
jgi:hypothetical protein